MTAHRTLAVNGIQLHIAEEGPTEGTGPLVVLCHGFPELWYSWRHQLPALAAAGYRAVAPDLRGYGDSSAPADPAAYDIDTLAADMVGLLDALGEQRAVFVGHDWGAIVVWHLALAHPERVSAVAGLSVPFVPRPPVPPLPVMRRRFGDAFYIVWFQEPGVADAALAADVARTISSSEVWTAEWAARTPPARPRRPAFLTEEDLDYYVAAFERSGFTGGLNYYRNLDRNWELTAGLAGRRVAQPALFVTGSRDPVRLFIPDRMDEHATDLRGRVVVEGGGHWIPQERPDEVNAALIRFLRSLEPGPTPHRR